MANGGFRGIYNNIAANATLAGKYTKNEVMYSIQDGNWYTDTFPIDILCVGAGGGAGGYDGDVTASCLGGAGAAVSGKLNYSRGGTLTISVGGGGGAGQSGASGGGGGTAGFNGGSAGGAAGGSGTSGAAGGGGGWSGVYHNSLATYLIVAGAGAGGGGGGEGPANNAPAAGGGVQNNGANSTSMFGTSGAAYPGDGGGWGGGGGGWYGGAAQNTSSGASSGGGNFANTLHLSSIVTVNGFAGYQGYGGNAANINWYGYPARTFAGGGGKFGDVSKPGANGTVIIRYAGNRKAIGGNVTTADGYTFHTYTSPGTFISRLSGYIEVADPFPSISGLLARYTTESVSGSTWTDLSGNGYNATISGATVQTVAAGNGGTITSCLKGTNGNSVSFPVGVLPATYTLFHVTRYSGANKQRIYNGQDNNWLSGHWGGLSGKFYHQGWISDSSTDHHGSNWIIVTDQNSLGRSNGVTRGTSGGSASERLGINVGANAASESSDFETAEVIVYNRTLNSTEYGQMESYLAAKYGITIA